MLLAVSARQIITISLRNGALIWSNVSKVNNSHEPVLSRGDVPVLLKCPLCKLRVNTDTGIVPAFSFRKNVLCRLYVVLLQQG